MNIFAIFNLVILVVTMTYPYDMTDKQKVIIFLISSLFTLFTTMAYNNAKKNIALLEAKFNNEGE